MSYSRNLINDHNPPWILNAISGNKLVDYDTGFGEWKIQLTMQVNFLSSIDSEEIQIMSKKIDNIEITMGNKTMILLMNF